MRFFFFFHYIYIFCGADFVTNIEHFLRDERAESSKKNSFCGSTDNSALSRRKGHVGGGGHPRTATRGRIDLGV